MTKPITKHANLQTTPFEDQINELLATVITGTRTERQAELRKALRYVEDKSYQPMSGGLSLFFDRDE